MTYRHVKRGSLYDVLGTIKVQSDTPVVDNEQLILYRARSDGSLWGRPPTEFFDPERFRALDKQFPTPLIGHPAAKVTGYPFPGEIRSVFWTRNNHRRFVVEATGVDYAGMLHIFNAAQLGFEDIGY